jgi:hypothetical protein
LSRCLLLREGLLGAKGDADEGRRDVGREVEGDNVRFFAKGKSEGSEEGEQLSEQT